MTAIIAELPNVNTEALARHYTLRCPDAIIHFVSTHSFLLPLLLEAPARIQDCFGMEVQMALEVFYDEESHSDPELFLLIRTSDAAEIVLQKQDCLRQVWWRQASREAKQQMNISVEFV